MELSPSIQSRYAPYPLLTLLHRLQAHPGRPPECKALPCGEHPPAAGG